MILSAGLSPAWQQILVVDRFRVGEVNRAGQAVWCSSGKVLNAGIAVHCLGCPGLVLAPVGGPPLAAIDRELADLGVPRRWIVTQSATRVCTTILDGAGGTTTELVEEGRPLTAGELAAFRAGYAEEAGRAEAVVLIGSLPRRTPLSLYRELLQETPCPAVLDFSGPGLLSVLDLKPLVVKPNREELSRTVGRPLSDDRQLLDAMRELNRRGAAWVVVTQGVGAVWVSSSSRAYRLHPPPVAAVVNPIGSGDALAAGIACSLRQGREMVEAVRWGVAAACDNLGQLLPCRVAPPRIEELAVRVRVEPV